MDISLSLLYGCLNFLYGYLIVYLWLIIYGDIVYGKFITFVLVYLFIRKFLTQNSSTEIYRFLIDNKLQ